MFFDVDNRIIYPRFDCDLDSEKLQSLIEELEKLKKSPYTEGRVMINESSYFIQCVFSNHIYFGAIVVKLLKNSINKPLLELMARVFTLIATKKDRVAELEIRKREEYLSDLITWNFRSDEVAVKLGLQVNWDITKIRQIVIVNMNIYQEKNGEFLSELEKHINTIQFPRIKHLVKKECSENIIGIRSDMLIILVAEKERQDSSKRVRDMCESIIENWNYELGGNISIGFSDYFDSPSSIPRAYTQATDAMRFVRTFLGENLCMCYNELGIYSMLQEIRANRNLIRNLKNSFSKLTEHDSENDQELEKTLKCLLLNDMETLKVSKIMNLHRNTVLYRKNKIYELLGYEPWRMPYLLNSMIWALL